MNYSLSEVLKKNYYLLLMLMFTLQPHFSTDTVFKINKLKNTK